MIQEDLQAIYKQGFIDGMTNFAWWKDGVQFVGTCGKTLKEAIEGIEQLSTYKKLQEMPPEEVPTNVRNAKGDFDRIHVLYGFIASDETGEGVIAIPTPKGLMPMIGADVARAESYMPMAQRAADESRKKVILAIFTDRRDVTTIVPNPKKQ